MIRKLWHEDDGAMAFEWVVVTTLVVLGVVGGLAAARDAVIDELGDVAQAMLSLDGSYTITYPLAILVDLDVTTGPGPEPVGLASDSSFVDAMAYTDCGRATAPGGQAVAADLDS